MKNTLILLIFATLLIEHLEAAQASTWEDEIKLARTAESKHNLAEAETCYRKAVQVCPSMDDKRYGQALIALLSVLNAQNKHSEALPISRKLTEYLIRQSSKRQSAAPVLDRSKFFKDNAIVGMSATRIHQLLGPPAVTSQRQGAQITGSPGIVSGSGTWSINDSPVDQLEDGAVRDNFILNRDSESKPLLWLDIDYSNNCVLRYRLRNTQEVGRWYNDNSEPSLPG